MDSTTITLFSEILKGAGRNSENGRKKGGIKAHTIIQEDIDLPIFVDFTAAATNDHELMKRIFSLPKGSFITFDMGYSDYLIWKQLTEAGYKFVTRQKDNARFEIIEKRRLS
jgi:Transposase DDE domain.